MGTELQWCGHPTACITSSDEGTNYCGWCASLEEAQKLAIVAYEAELLPKLSDRYAQMNAGFDAALDAARAEERERCALIASAMADLFTGEGSMAATSIADVVGAREGKEEPKCG